MRFLKEVLIIVNRDMRIEFREKTLLLSMIIFALLIQVLLNISFDAQFDALRKIAPGMLWLPIVLAAILGFSKYGSSERKNGANLALLISPMSRGAIFLGKLIGNMLIVLSIAILSIPAFFLFLKMPYPESPLILIVTTIMGVWGFSAIGVFLSALAIYSSITELLVPIMLFPLSIPLFIAAIRLTETALFPTVTTDQILWFSVLAGYNLIFTIVPLLLFDVLLEEV